MVDVKNLGYSAWSVISYQRTTVIISELVMALALRSSVPHERKEIFY
jgi:alpha-1,3-glucosyltransferase